MLNLMRLAISLSILVGLALSGCGGSSTNDTSSGGNAGTSGSGGSTGGSGATGGSGGSSASGGTGGATDCTAFTDAPEPTADVTIRLENARTDPIYLGGGVDCGPTPLYSLEGPNGGLQLSAGNCDSTCQDLQQHGPYCTGACQQPFVVMIAAGGHYDLSWAGVTYQAQTMPASCYWDPSSASPSCDRRVVPDAGSYSALADAATDVSCGDPNGCDCTPDASGSCQILGGNTLSGTPLSAKATFDYPTSMVTVTFQ
jgi:hypothetical protein